MSDYETEVARLTGITDDAGVCALRICAAAGISESELAEIQAKNLTAGELIDALNVKYNAVGDESLIGQLIEQQVGLAKTISHAIDMSEWDETKFYPIVINGDGHRLQDIELVRHYAKLPRVDVMGCFLKIRTLAGSYGGNPNGVDILEYRWSYKQAVARVGTTATVAQTVIYARGGYYYDLLVSDDSEVFFYEENTTIYSNEAGTIIFKVEPITEIDSVLTDNIRTNSQPNLVSA